MRVVSKFALLAGSVSLVAIAATAVAEQQQTAAASDTGYVARAMSAAPEHVSKNATIIAMEKDGSMRTLRQGTNEFTCMVDPANNPMCLDKNSMEWAHAWQTHATPPDKVGFMYMLQGDTGASNTDPYATEKKPDNHWVKTGAHVMVVGPTVKAMEGYPRTADADPTKPYVMWPGTPYEHLMLPVK